MTYRVVELPTPGNDFEDELNHAEEDGWTLVHIVQGFTTTLEDAEARTTVHWRPRFILHKRTKAKGKLHV